MIMIMMVMIICFESTFKTRNKIEFTLSSESHDTKICGKKYNSLVPVMANCMCHLDWTT